MKRARVLGLLLVLVLVGFGVGRVQGETASRPAPWPEMWATHPLQTSPVSAGFPLLVAEDTFISQEQPNTNFGSLTYAEIGPQKRALLKFNLADLPTQGALPIQRLHLAVAMIDTVPDSFWLGAAGVCQEWQETTAVWSNANCLPPSANTTFPPTTPHWEFIELRSTGPGNVPLSSSGYVLFDTSNGYTRRFLTREAGEEWAPRLVVVYARDSNPPTLTGDTEPNGPDNLTFFAPHFHFSVYMQDDAGLSRVVAERRPESGGPAEQAEFVLENGCTAGLYQSRSAQVYPFAVRPMGVPYRYSVWVEDCLGKRSAPLVFSRLVHVKRIEYAIVRDFLGEPLPAAAVMREGDRGNTGLQPSPSYFGSITDSPVYWVSAPGFAEGSAGVLVGEQIQSAPPGVQLYVPWYDFEKIQAAGMILPKETVVPIPLIAPQGENLILGIVGRVNADVAAEDATPSGRLTLAVEDTTGHRTTLSNSHINYIPSYFPANLTQWAGQPVTVTLSFSPNFGKEWSAILGDVVLSAQNPDLSVQGGTLVQQTETWRQGAPLAIGYGVEGIRATRPTTLTLSVPSAVELTNFSLDPTSHISDTTGAAYGWVFPRLVTGSRVLTATVAIAEAGAYELDLTITNEWDSRTANNQAKLQLVSAGFLLYLPELAR